MTTDDLIRSISIVSGFTIKDSKVFYDALVEVLQDSVSALEPIKAVNLFNLTYTKVKSRSGNNQADVIARLQDPSIEIRKVNYPETWRIKLTPAGTLKDIVRGISVDDELEVEQDE